MPERILLTGATGFLGYYLTRSLLATAHDIRLLVRPNTDLSHLQTLDTSRLEFVKGDLLDIFSLEAALEGCSTVIHAAAVVSFSATERQQMHDVNVTGTANLVNAAISTATVQRFIHISSVAALERNGQQPISEQNRWQETKPPTPYAATKFAAEREVWRGQAEGLSVAALYPSLIIGAGNWLGASTPKLFHAADQGRKFYPCGHTGIVDVRDVASATVKVLERAIDGERFLLNACNLSWKDLLSRIAISINATAPKLKVPAWQSAILWPFAVLYGKLSKSPPLLTKSIHRTAQAHYQYDGNKITQELGFHYLAPQQTFHETGTAYLQSFTAHASEPQTSWLPNL